MTVQRLCKVWCVPVAWHWTSLVFCLVIIPSAAQPDQRHQLETGEVASDLSFLMWHHNLAARTSERPACKVSIVCSRETGLGISHEPGPDHNHRQNSPEIWEDVCIISIRDSAAGKLKVKLESKVCLWKPLLALSNNQTKHHHQFGFSPCGGARAGASCREVKLLLGRYFSPSSAVIVCSECHFN